MTGPLAPHNDDGVVELLRAAGHGGGDPSPVDVHRAVSAGRRIRRRRQTAQVLGSGLAIVAVLGVGITTVTALNDNDGTPVTTADDPGPTQPGPAAGSNAALAAGYLAEDLGDRWVNKDGTVHLDPTSTAAEGLPEGGYAATAHAEIVSRSAFHQVCDGAGGKLPCEEMTTSDGATLHLWNWADHDLTTGEVRGEAAAYRALDSGKYQLIGIKLDGPEIPAAQRDAHVNAVKSWYDAQKNGLRTAVTDTRIENSLTIEPSLAEVVLARNANVTLLMEALGADFRVNVRGERPGAILRAGSPAAADLPAGYEAAAEIWVKAPTEGAVKLEDLCTPLTEDGLRRSGCTAVTTADGRTVQIQTRDWMPTAGSNTSAYSALFAFFDRGDGSFVEVRMTATDTTDRPSTARQEAAAAWLAKYRDTLAGVAADPEVKPGPAQG